MKKIIYIFCLLVGFSCTKKDDIEPFYNTNIEISDTELLENDWSNNSLKIVTLTLEETFPVNSEITVKRETDLMEGNFEYDNFNGDINIEISGNSIDIAIDPLNQVGYYDMLFSINKNGKTKYISISSNINNENKQFLSVFKTITDNLNKNASLEYPNLDQSFVEQSYNTAVFTNTNGDLISSNENNNRIFSSRNDLDASKLEKIFGFDITAIVLFKHSNIN